MNRQERRRNKVKNHNPTYTYSKEQLNKMLAEERTKAVNEALVLMFTLPCEVLMDSFWPKSYHKKLPKFANLLTDCYEKWQNGEIRIEDLRKDLWEYGGIGFAETDK